MDTLQALPEQSNQKKKKKKQPWQIVIKDRFLTNDKPENPYVVALLYFFVFFMSFLLIFVCFFQLCEVHKESMMNTLHNGDHVLLLKEVSSYKRGDIVVIQTQTNDGTKNTTNIIKRIIGVPGDTLLFKTESNKDDANVFLYIKKAGEEEFSLYEEPYIKEQMKKDTPGFEDFTFNTEIVIPEEHFYVMGDNRAVSRDSRAGNEMYTKKNMCGKSVMLIKKGSLLEIFLQLLYRDNNLLD